MLASAYCTKYEIYSGRKSFPSPTHDRISAFCGHMPQLFSHNWCRSLSRVLTNVISSLFESIIFKWIKHLSEIRGSLLRGLPSLLTYSCELRVLLCHSRSHGLHQCLCSSKSWGKRFLCVTHILNVKNTPSPSLYLSTAFLSRNVDNLDQITWAKRFCSDVEQLARATISRRLTRGGECVLCRVGSPEFSLPTRVLLKIEWCTCVAIGT